MSMIVPTILTNDKNLYMRQYEAYSKFAKRIQEYVNRHPERMKTK